MHLVQGRVPVHLVFFTLHESQARVIFCRPALFVFDSDPEAFLLRPGMCASAMWTTLSNIPGPEPCCVGIGATMLFAAMSGSTLGNFLPRDTWSVCIRARNPVESESEGEESGGGGKKREWRDSRLFASGRAARGSPHPRIYIKLEHEQPLLAKSACEMGRGSRRGNAISEPGAGSE